MKMGNFSAQQNPEALHDVAQDTTKQVSDNFVTPGIATSPLVTRDMMHQATINGAKDIMNAKVAK